MCPQVSPVAFCINSPIDRFLGKWTLPLVLNTLSPLFIPQAFMRLVAMHR